MEIAEYHKGSQAIQPTLGRANPGEEEREYERVYSALREGESTRLLVAVVRPSYVLCGGFSRGMVRGDTVAWWDIGSWCALTWRFYRYLVVLSCE